MEIKPNFWIATIHDSTYDKTIQEDTTKFFDSFTGARIWLTKTCIKRAKELVKRGKLRKGVKSLFGTLKHFYCGNTANVYTWNNYAHEYDTGEFQLECLGLEIIGYPRISGGHRGNMIKGIMPADEYAWLLKYLDPQNKSNVYDYEYRHEKVYGILTDKYKWNESIGDWEEIKC